MPTLGGVLPALIAVSFWGCPSVTILSWATSPPSRGTSAPGGGTNENGLLEEIATWCPISERNSTTTTSADLDTSGATSSAAERVVVIRALTFLKSDGEQKRIQLVAGMANGSIAVAEGKVYGEKKNTENFVTTAILQVGRRPVELQVFRRDPCEGIGSAKEGGESVFLSSGDIDAVLRYCPESGISTPCGGWRCSQVGDAT